MGSVRFAYLSNGWQGIAGLREGFMSEAGRESSGGTWGVEMLLRMCEGDVVERRATPDGLIREAPSSQ